eukprot:scaffold1352_cov261-Pinguiococcus_pyrenoidosus.AAC.15
MSVERGGASTALALQPLRQTTSRMRQLWLFQLSSDQRRCCSTAVFAAGAPKTGEAGQLRSGAQDSFSLGGLGTRRASPACLPPLRRGLQSIDSSGSEPTLAEARVLAIVFEGGQSHAHDPWRTEPSFSISTIA